MHYIKANIAAYLTDSDQKKANHGSKSVAGIGRRKRIIQRVPIESKAQDTITIEEEFHAIPWIFTIHPHDENNLRSGYTTLDISAF